MENSISFPFLYSLVGRNIQVYKGGPESKTGLLAAVKSDYLTLSTKEGAVYYRLAHLKSIVEDSHASMDQAGSFVMETDNTFAELLASLMYKVVRVNQGGPESRHGRLLAVKPDHLVVLVAGEAVYYNLEHVKSISESADKKASEMEAFPVYVEADSIQNLLYSAKHQWVTINRGGPESLDGILTEIFEDHIMLIQNNKIFRVANFHIKSVSLGAKGKKDNSNSASSGNSASSSSSENNSSSQSGQSGDQKKDSNSSSGSLDWASALRAAVTKDTLEKINARLNTRFEDQGASNKGSQGRRR